MFLMEALKSGIIKGDIITEISVIQLVYGKPKVKVIEKLIIDMKNKQKKINSIMFSLSPLQTK